MTRLPNISGYEMVKILKRFDWIPVRQTGYHVIMKKADSIYRIVVPQHKELKPGIIHQIMKEAELSLEMINKSR